MDNKPIGIFDSGLGGLTVLKQIRKVLPNENIVYLGDTARVPYGTRSKKVITKFSLQCSYFLAGKGVKCIVVACNTSSSNSIKRIKKEINLPIFDVVESSVKDVINEKKYRKVGVIGTNATIESHVHKEALKKHGVAVLHETACPLLVPLVEAGEVDGDIIKSVVSKYLSNFTGIDCLILGCTHYPVIEKVISEVVGKKIGLIDPANQLARSVNNYLVDNKKLNEAKKPTTTFFLTDITKNFQKVAKVFLGKSIDNHIKQVELM